MIFGIGNDIIEIGRIKKAAENQRFLLRYFTKAEREGFPQGIRRPESIAGAFAAKEAVAKAIGTGFSGFEAMHIEILHNKNGMPYVHLLGPAKELAQKLQIVQFYISISHCKEYAAAIAIAEKTSE